MQDRRCRLERPHTRAAEAMHAFETDSFRMMFPVPPVASRLADGSSVFDATDGERTVRVMVTTYATEADAIAALAGPFPTAPGATVQTYPRVVDGATGVLLEVSGAPQKEWAVRLAWGETLVQATASTTAGDDGARSLLLTLRRSTKAASVRRPRAEQVSSNTNGGQGSANPYDDAVSSSALPLVPPEHYQSGDLAIRSPAAPVEPRPERPPATSSGAQETSMHPDTKTADEPFDNVWFENIVGMLQVNRLVGLALLRLEYQRINHGMLKFAKESAKRDLELRQQYVLECKRNQVRPDNSYTKYSDSLPMIALMYGTQGEPGNFENADLSPELKALALEILTDKVDFQTMVRLRNPPADYLQTMIQFANQTPGGQGVVYQMLAEPVKLLAILVVPREYLKWLITGQNPPKGAQAAAPVAPSTANQIPAVGIAGFGLGPGPTTANQLPAVGIAGFGLGAGPTPANQLPAAGIAGFGLGAGPTTANQIPAVGIAGFGLGGAGFGLGAGAATSPAGPIPSLGQGLMDIFANAGVPNEIAKKALADMAKAVLEGNQGASPAPALNAAEKTKAPLADEVSGRLRSALAELESGALNVNALTHRVFANAGKGWSPSEYLEVLWSVAEVPYGWCEAGKLEAAYLGFQMLAGLAPTTEHPHALQLRMYCHFMLGVVHSKAKRIDASIASYSRAIELKPDSASLTNRGECYLVIGRLQEGLADLRGAVALGAHDAFAQRAQLLLDAQESLKSRDWLTKIEGTLGKDIVFDQLLQILCTTKKSGVLTIKGHFGDHKFLFDGGLVRSFALNDQPVTWKKARPAFGGGTFSFNASADMNFGDRCELSYETGKPQWLVEPRSR